MMQLLADPLEAVLDPKGSQEVQPELLAAELGSPGMEILERIHSLVDKVSPNNWVGAALIIAAIVLPLLERRALKTGPLDRPGGRKNHDRPTPLTGGIAVLLSVAIPAMAGLFLALRGVAMGDVLPAELADHLPGIRRRAPQLLAILLGSAVMMLLGHIDDRRGLSPWLRSSPNWTNLSFGSTGGVGQSPHELVHNSAAQGLQAFCFAFSSNRLPL